MCKYFMAFYGRFFFVKMWKWFKEGSPFEKVKMQRHAVHNQAQQLLMRILQKLRQDAVQGGLD